MNTKIDWIPKCNVHDFCNILTVKLLPYKSCTVCSYEMKTTLPSSVCPLFPSIL